MYIPKTKLVLPPLPYSFDGLEPVTSSRALQIHYKGNHAGYVKNFNRLLIEGGSQADLEFNYSGHILHCEFWKSYSPLRTAPGNATLSLINDTYPNVLYPLGNFVNEIVETAMKIKGSGWAIAIIDRGQLKVTSIPNHDLKKIIHANPVLVLDGWEHVFFLDYANKKKAFFEGIVELINWDTVEQRVLS